MSKKAFILNINIMKTNIERFICNNQLICINIFAHTFYIEK